MMMHAMIVPGVDPSRRSSICVPHHGGGALNHCWFSAGGESQDRRRRSAMSDRIRWLDSLP